jgi:putative YhbY family RNA-binding protein
MLSITPAERRELRARAHRLQPVVSIGHNGLTPAVLHEIDVNLAAHELIKVRVFADRTERANMFERICIELEAAPVQHIGKLLVVWRPALTEPPVEAAKKAPQVRRPRTPFPRTPSRPPVAPGGRTRRPAIPAGGRRRRPHP